MNFLHWDGWVEPDDVVVVTLDHAANVQLLDDAAFAAYRSMAGVTPGVILHSVAGLGRICRGSGISV